MEKIKKLSGIFWASDVLNARKPIPVQSKKQNKGFDKLLNKEMEKLDARKC